LDQSTVNWLEFIWKDCNWLRFSWILIVFLELYYWKNSMGLIRICWSYLDLFWFIRIIWINVNLLGWIGIWWDWLGLSWILFAMTGIDCKFLRPYLIVHDLIHWMDWHFHGSYLNLLELIENVADFIDSTWTNWLDGLELTEMTW
jgi:hypothetical protein